jgi:predicted RNA binding protein YcfA (HicA-like mRNA interferase family)
MNVREEIRLLNEDGWIQISQKGSHRQFKHPIKSGKVTVPGNLGEDVPKGTCKSIFCPAEIEEFE